MKPTNFERQLLDAVRGFALDPLGFVRFAYPWGEAGTELVDATGPREWQAELLAEFAGRDRDCAVAKGAELRIARGATLSRGQARLTVSRRAPRTDMACYCRIRGMNTLARARLT